MTLGVTTGKFYPFHLGHDHLLREASKQVDRLVVLIGRSPTGRTPPADVRAGWIRSLHPGVEVIEVLEDIPEAPEPWAKRALEVLGRPPDVAFTSEAYGEPWAEHMGARHVCVDLDRARFPVSGTQLRADLGAHWGMLTSPAKAHFARRVRVIGVDSSGKSTLAAALATHHQTAWVAEFGRHYWEERNVPADTWTSDEFLTIAKGQAAWEDARAAEANRVLICDTDPLTTHVWRRRYLGAYDRELEALSDARTYALTLLTAPDFEFVQDGTRDDAPELRATMHQWFLDELARKDLPFVIVGGSPSERIARANAAIEPLFAFAPLP